MCNSEMPRSDEPRHQISDVAIDVGMEAAVAGAGPHRIAKLYYAPRALGFFLAFLSFLVLLVQDVVGGWGLPYAVGVLLVYPHLAFLRSSYADDSKRAELQNLVIDAWLLGGLTALTGFNLGLSFALFTSVCLNNAINGGYRRLIVSALSFSAACVITLFVVGWRFMPDSSLIATLMGLSGVLIYVIHVSMLFHDQNRRLVQVKREINNKRNLFQALASSGLEATRAEELDKLVDNTFGHLDAVLGQKNRFAIVVRDSKRPSVIHYSSASAMDPAEQSWIFDAIEALDPLKPVTELLHPVSGAAYRCFVIGSAQGLFEGVVALHRKTLGEDDIKAVGMFVQQLDVALENRLLTQRLTELAATDALTGVVNRGTFDSRLAGALEEKRKRPDADFALLVVDVNGLKTINDGYGHEAGDGLLVSAADVLARVCRSTDVVARVGGDEFVVLCPATTREEATRLVGRLQTAVAATEVPMPARGGHAVAVPLSLSMGAADSREVEPRGVLKLADKRMYADKAAYYRSAVF